MTTLIAADSQHDLRTLRRGLRDTFKARRFPIRRVVIHYTTQAWDRPDDAPRDHAHRCIHNWLASEDCGVSVHAVVDPWETAICLPDDYEAIGARAGNRHEYHIEHACNGEWTEIEQAGLLDIWLSRSAELTARVCVAHNIPIVRLDPATWEDHDGIIGHGDIQPEDRIDPGPDFNWTRFLQLASDHARALEYPRSPSIPLAQSSQADRVLRLDPQQTTPTKIVPPRVTEANRIERRQRELNDWLREEHSHGRYLSFQVLVEDGIVGPKTRQIEDLYAGASREREALERDLALAEAGDVLSIDDSEDEDDDSSRKQARTQARSRSDDDSVRSVPAAAGTRTKTRGPSALPAGFQQVDRQLAIEGRRQVAIQELRLRNPDHPAATSSAEFRKTFWHEGHPVYEAAVGYALAVEREEMRRTALIEREVYDREFTRPVVEQRVESARPVNDAPLGPSQRYGKRPADVRWLQTLLSDLGYAVKSTGKWNRATTRALRMLQETYPYTPQTPGEMSEQADWTGLVEARKALDQGLPPSRAMKRAAQAAVYDLHYRDDPRISHETLQTVNRA